MGITGMEIQVFLEDTILHDRVTLLQIRQVIENHLLGTGEFSVSGVMKHTDKKELDDHMFIAFHELELDMEIFLLPTNVEGEYFVTEIGSTW